MVILGIDALTEKDLSPLRGLRAGLLCNQASVNKDLIHSRFLLADITDRGRINLTCLFSPQHGFAAEKQDNMIESDHIIDDKSGLEVFSLYGTDRKPSRDMFDLIDVLFVDLIDVGTRVYTFMYTMAYCLQAAATYGKKIVILDRPNPIGGLAVEGNLLREEFSSFVGLYPIPMRHGMTLGELALFFNEEFSIDADLQIIKLNGWQRSMYFEDTGLPWVFPSPNMPTPTTALVYPGQVIWEGTNVSEGRGTTLPFELVGAPYWDVDLIEKKLGRCDLPGCMLRAIVFEPTSGKWAGHGCNGFHLHVIDRGAFRPYRTSLALLQAVLDLYPDDFQYKEPPYEYEYEKLPMDLIIGDQKIRKQIEQGTSVVELEDQWQAELDKFLDIRSKYLLYH